MKKNIGFLLPKLETEIHAKIVNHISMLIDNNPDKQILIFCSTAKLGFPPNVPVLHINEAKYFDGEIFVFDMLSALIVKNFKTQSKKYFWIGNNIPWKSNPLDNCKTYSDIFNDKSISFIVSDEHTKDIYSICFQEPAFILKEFNHENLQRIVG